MGRAPKNAGANLGKRSRHALIGVSEQMKAWSAALADELSDWPQVATRSFFGFTALYRNEFMFAALPRTRAMETANSLVFKVENPSARLRRQLESDRRIGSMDMQKARWFTFELSSDADLHDALDWLGRAYNAAAKLGNKSRKQR
jgi:predicted DNA-binding protein (MmcQ/YjbR family)